MKRQSDHASGGIEFAYSLQYLSLRISWRKAYVNRLAETGLILQTLTNAPIVLLDVRVISAVCAFGG